MKTYAPPHPTRRPPRTGNRVPRTSQAQSMHRERFSAGAAIFRDLNGSRKAAWGALSARLTGAGGGRVLTARQFFLQVAMGRAALGLMPLLDAPAVPVLPPFLPMPTVTASVAGGRLSLKLTGVDYPCAVQVSGWAWRVCGGPPPQTARPPVLTVLPSLTGDGADFGSDYARQFGPGTANREGMEVWLRLVGISEQGFRTPPLDVRGVVEG